MESKLNFYIDGIHNSDLSKIKKYINKDNINIPIYFNETFSELPLYGALKTGNYEIIKYFLDLGAAPNRIFIENESNTLHYLILEEKEFWKNLPKKDPDFQIVKLLIEYGADINVLSKEGETPLDYSIGWGGEDQVFKCLRSLGAKTSKEINKNKIT